MNKNSGYLVETKIGLEGRTYHYDDLINGKIIVYIEKDNKNIKMLCDPDTLKLIGFID